MNQAEEQNVRQQLKALLKRVKSATELSAGAFGPNGVLTGLCKTRNERESLVKSKLYKWAQDRLSERV